MVVKDFNSILYEEKKSKFLECVSRTAKMYGIPTPAVVFMEDSKWDGEDEIAHIHINQAEIHIRKVVLANLTFDEIERTASHEVKHMTDKEDQPNPRHKDSWYREEEQMQATIFTPRSGIISIDSNTPYNPFKGKPKQKPVIDKENCNYHLCRKKSKLTQCNYCTNYYCQIHIKPFLPATFDGKKSNRSKTGHPCVEYARSLLPDTSEDNSFDENPEPFSKSKLSKKDTKKLHEVSEEERNILLGNNIKANNRKYMPKQKKPIPNQTKEPSGIFFFIFCIITIILLIIIFWYNNFR